MIRKVYFVLMHIYYCATARFRKEVVGVPFGMGPIGWFMFPYLLWSFPLGFGRGFGRGFNWFMLPYLMFWLGYPYTYRYYWRYLNIYPTIPYIGPITPYVYRYDVPAISKEEELKMLGGQAKLLEDQLGDIKKRMEVLKK